MSESLKPQLSASQAARCRGCGELITFEKTATGKLMPTNLDGTSHFGTCPKAASFSRKEKKTKCPTQNSSKTSREAADR